MSGALEHVIVAQLFEIRDGAWEAGAVAFQRAQFREHTYRNSDMRDMR